MRWGSAAHHHGLTHYEHRHDQVPSKASVLWLDPNSTIRHAVALYVSGTNEISMYGGWIALDAFAYTTDHFCMSITRAPLRRPTRGSMRRHTLLMDLSSFTTHVSTPITYYREIQHINNYYYKWIIVWGERTYMFDLLIAIIDVLTFWRKFFRRKKKQLATMKKKIRNRSHNSGSHLLRDWEILPLRINTFLIILNSHQIELAGVTSSATRGVINEIIGINFD